MKRAWMIEGGQTDGLGIFLSFAGRSRGVSGFEWRKIPIAEELLPIEVELDREVSDPDEIPDFAYGPMDTGITVRRAFIDLVEEMDPGALYFAPMELILSSGKRVENTFWRINSAKPIDAMVPEKSTVEPSTIRKGHFSWARGRRLTFDQARIGERHIWTLSNLTLGLFASDDFVEQMKQRGMEPFRRTEMGVE